jgi:hypothetical protein
VSAGYDRGKIGTGDRYRWLGGARWGRKNALGVVCVLETVGECELWGGRKRPVLALQAAATFCRWLPSPLTGHGWNQLNHGASHCDSDFLSALL